MIRLEQRDYGKATEILSKITTNTLFARAVVQGMVSGRIFVDRVRYPRTFYILHSYGMSLLAGDSTNPEFNAGFRSYALNEHGVRDRHEWMQVWPGDWNDTLTRLLGESLVPAGNPEEKGVVELNGRVNFKFSPVRYAERRRTGTASSIKIVRTDEKLFREMSGSVVPRYFWDSVEDFSRSGVGFSLIANGRLAATAFSAYIIDNQLETGIETLPDFRKTGFAELVCGSLIDYCLTRGYEPVWSCRFENTPSRLLALKMGFDPVSIAPYYRLSR